MYEPTDHETELFEHYQSDHKNKLTEEILAFDVVFKDLKDLMAEVMQGGGADSIAEAVNKIMNCRSEVTIAVTDVTDLVLLEENGVFEPEEGIAFWADFVHTYESDLIKWVAALTDKKPDGMIAASSVAQLRKQAAAYAGLITTAEMDPADKDYIDTRPNASRFESTDDTDEDEDVDDTDWVIILRDERMVEIIDSFLEHIPPNTVETWQKRNERIRRIARGAFQAAVYAAIPLAVSRFFGRKSV